MKITFDTNSYRFIAEKNTLEEGMEYFRDIKARETEKGIMALQSTFVLNELFKYLGDNTSHQYENCKNSIILSSFHCINYELLKNEMLAAKEFYSEKFCPSSDLALVRWVADFLRIPTIPLNATTRTLVNVDLSILKMASDLYNANDKELYLTSIKTPINNIKSHVETLRNYYYNGIQEIYNFIPSVRGWKFPELDKQKNKVHKEKLLSRIDYYPYMMTFSFLLREEIVKSFPNKFYKARDITRLDAHILPDLIGDEYGVPQ